MKRTIAVLAVALMALAACGGDDDAAAPDDTTDVEAAATDLPQATITSAEGVVETPGLTNEHVRTQVDYPSTPPVGGDHYPGWQTCGYYTVPIEDERAVHSLEHGAIWIAYTPGTDLGPLPEQADSGDYLLLSPYGNLPAPLVASAWGAQLQLLSVADPALADFIATYQGIGLEPGAPCASNGEGTPPTDTGGPLD